MADDRELVEFLQWALPRLRLRWAGMRRVRGQVRKRIARRIHDLEVGDLAGYRARLISDDSEWDRLDALCRITISRFYRDRIVFDRVRELLRSVGSARCWSAGCASGEEPYTLALIGAFDHLGLDILATEADPRLLVRAALATYADSSLRELPTGWSARAFIAGQLRPELRQAVRFLKQDIRDAMPEGPFELILCRNLVFTYFEPRLQHELMPRLRDRLSAELPRRLSEVTVKYIDPSYTIRSLPANAYDAQLCLVLGQHAVHAGMSGRTNMLVGTWNQRFTHVPIPLAISTRRRMDPSGEAWQRVLEATGQPASMVARGR